MAYCLFLLHVIGGGFGPFRNPPFDAVARAIFLSPMTGRYLDESSSPARDRSAAHTHAVSQQFPSPWKLGALQTLGAHVALGILMLLTANVRANDDDAEPGSATIRGRVTDASTGAPLPWANIMLVEAQTGTATDGNGQFQLNRIRAGQYTLRITYVGYESHRMAVTVAGGHDQQLDIGIRPSSVSVGEVRVTAAERSNNPTGGLGARRLPAEELAKIPSALQPDLFRSLQKLPGIKASSDFSSGLHIRGGSPDQTLVRLDGATLYNPTHFLGLFSSFNPDAVADVTLYKGAFPVGYGGRLGSVVDISQHSGSDRLHGSARVGLLASRASIEGPIDGGTWTLSVRRSTMEPVLDRMNARGIDGLPDTFHFYDINGKASVRLSRASRLAASVYTGYDEMDFPFQRNLVFDVAYGNRAGTIQWTHVPDEHLSAQIAAAASQYTTDSRAEMTRRPFSRYNQITDVSIRSDLDYRATDQLTVEGGVRTGYVVFDLHDMNAQVSTLNRSGQSLRNSLYVQTRLDMSPSWTFTGGLRESYFTSGGYFRLAPRFSVEYRPTSRLHLQAAGGRYHQFVTRSPSQLLASFDAWLTAAPGVAPASSNQFTVGIEWTTDSWRINGDGYVRSMAHLFKLDTRGLDGSGLQYAELFRVGSGYAYGTELLLKRTAGPLRGFIAYTFGRTRERFPEINRGRSYAPKYDRAHDLNLLINYALSDQWRISGTFSFASGQPYTRPTSQFVLTGSPTRQWRNLFITSYNNARLPAYRRTDVGITRSGELSRRFHYEASFHVVNVFSHRNPWLKVYDFAQDYSVETTDMPQIPVPLPNLSFRVQF